MDTYINAKDKEVVYYPGCFASYWDVEIGKAVVDVLERNNLRVILPKHQCCGIVQVGYGDFKGAYKSAAKLVGRLFPFAEQEHDIVTACPSCSLAIKQEYPFLLRSKEAKLVSERTYFLSQYLNQLYERGELNTDFKRMHLSVAYHTPCHLKAQSLDRDSINLMALILGLEVIDLDRGCCGMAGTAGFKRRYYEASMNIGSALFERIKEIGVQIVATDCGGCKIQIEEATNAEVIHPVIILDKAYKGGQIRLAPSLAKD